MLRSFRHAELLSTWASTQPPQTLVGRVVKGGQSSTTLFGGEGRQWAILSGIHDILRPCLRGMPDIWWSVAWRVIYRSVLHVGVVGRRKRCRGDGQNSEALETHM